MEEVKIMGIPYKVIEKECISNEDVMGDILFHDQLIRLKASLPNESKHQTLFHEIIHGILIGIGESRLNEDERFVQSLATGIYLLIKENDFSFMREGGV